MSGHETAVQVVMLAGYRQHRGQPDAAGLVPR